MSVKMDDDILKQFTHLVTTEINDFQGEIMDIEGNDGLMTLNTLLKESNDEKVLLSLFNSIEQFLNCKQFKERKRRISVLMKDGTLIDSLLALETRLIDQRYTNLQVIESFYSIIGKFSHYDKNFIETLEDRNRKSLFQPVYQLEVFHKDGCNLSAAILSYLKEILENPNISVAILEKTTGEAKEIDLMNSSFNIVKTYKITSNAFIYALDVVALLCRSKPGILELISPGNDYLTTLSKCLLDAGDLLNKKKLTFKCLRIIDAILCIFLHVGYLKAGRRAIKGTNLSDTVLILMRKLLQQRLNSKYVERFGLLSSLTIQRCLAPLPLPISSHSAFSFKLPVDHTPENIDPAGTNSSANNVNGTVHLDNVLTSVAPIPDVNSDPFDNMDKGDDDYLFSESGISSDGDDDSDVESDCNSEFHDSEEIAHDVLSYSHYFKELKMFPLDFDLDIDKIKDHEVKTDVEDDEELINQLFTSSLSSPSPSTSTFSEKSDSNNELDKNSFDSNNNDDEDIKDDSDGVQDIEEVREKLQGKLDDRKESFKFWSNNVKSAIPFKKVANCILSGDVKGNPDLEPLLQNSLHNGIWFTKLIDHVEQRLNATKSFTERIVYDIHKDINIDGALKFESRFENGNLRRVIQTDEYEYTLLLNADINTSSHGQWFYFEVTSMKAGVDYKFNVINCRKQRSLFRDGMRPLIYSEREATDNKPYWARVGTNITYYRNHYVDNDSFFSVLHGNPYYTMTFTLSFQHDDDVCYLAYNYPYTYSLLQTHLNQWEKSVDRTDIYFDKQILCQTLCGNDVPILTITSTQKHIKRQYVLLMARVHPSESPSSWNIKGSLDFLLSNHPDARRLREKYVFKIIPMMNPDGVINGSSRTSLSGDDLNRQWLRPHPLVHPTIYHTKMLLKYITLISKKTNPVVFMCDLHSHSHRNNVFLYGCAPALSWRKKDRLRYSQDGSCFIVPLLLKESAPIFNINYCNFTVEKSKEGTARVTAWKDFGIKFSYTLECTHGGCDQGVYRSFHVGLRQLKEMGAYLCQTLRGIKFKTIDGQRIPQYPDHLQNEISKILTDITNRSQCSEDEHI